MSDEEIFPVEGLVRAARRLGDLSQREMAERAGVSASAIGRIETGSLMPGLELFRRILEAAGLWLAVVDEDGTVIQPMKTWDDTQDGGGRRYPAHLDLILDPAPGEWWGTVYGLRCPPETFRRNRAARDSQRDRSRWDVGRGRWKHADPPSEPGVPPRRAS